MNLMSNTNRTESSPAASIRKSLAALGFTSREVSVRSDRNSFRITIKTPTLGSKTVKDIAKRFEKIDRCERSGEILGGGNTFVFVDHSDQIKTALATTIKNETAAEIATKGWATWGQYEIQNPTSTSEERFKAYFTGGDCGHSLDRSTCWTLNQAIERVVDHVLETGYTAEEPAGSGYGYGSGSGYGYGSGDGYGYGDGYGSGYGSRLARSCRPGRTCALNSPASLIHSPGETSAASRS